jgi:hypothetical protein
MKLDSCFFFSSDNGTTRCSLLLKLLVLPVSVVDRHRVDADPPLGSGADLQFLFKSGSGSYPKFDNMLGN